MEEILKIYRTAEVSKRIQDNIRENRCCDFEIAFVDEKGCPISCDEVAVKQISHDFKFGANCFMVDELETEEKNAKYEESFAKVFNIATLPFYWNSLEPQRGKPRFDKDSPRVYRRPAIDKLIEFCKKHNIEPKGHCLNYEPFIPDWAKELDFVEYKKALENRMKIIAERYADEICDFEVMNEILQKKNWETEARKDVKWSFATARKYFKNNKLIINEGNNVWDDHLKGNDQYYDLIKENLNHNVPIDGVGIQGHLMWGTAESINPYNLWSFFEKYENLGLPLSITEVTIPSVFNDKTDGEMQAEILKNVYSLWFGIKGMEAIIYWNLIDGYAYGAQPGDMSVGENVYRGGLLNFDGEEKIAYKVLGKLINQEWKTHFEGKTDDKGRMTFNGFYGDYEICFRYNGKVIKKRITLNRNHSQSNIVCR
ncbi:MAG: endo-1,4-beta-xylanase [Clostridia bacterium]|nr:endo-1,4-beta-xylanase [Clostridia bacterium]